jgi:hypothetical protein
MFRNAISWERVLQGFSIYMKMPARDIGYRTYGCNGGWINSVQEGILAVYSLSGDRIIDIIKYIF